MSTTNATDAIASQEETATIIFLHIAKAGGTTLREALLWQHGIYRWNRRLTISNGEDDFRVYRDLPERERRQLRILHGHMRFGVHEYVPGPFQYVTMLREPVRRIISLYYHIRASYTTEQFSASLEEFIHERHRAYTPNDQVRRLAGIHSERADCPEETLETAKRHIEEYIPVVGLTKRFDESLMLMKRRFGWTRPPLYARANTNSCRPPLAELPKDLLATVREQNALDLALYDYAQERLEGQLVEEGSALQDDLRHFRRMNRIFGKLAPIGRWLLRKVRSLL